VPVIRRRLQPGEVRAAPPGELAIYADLTHRVPHPDGPTCAQNLQTLCRRHHRLKTAGDFSSRLSTSTDAVPGTVPGTAVWTTPTGRQYERPPTKINPMPALIGSHVPKQAQPHSPPQQAAPPSSTYPPEDPPPF